MNTQPKMQLFRLTESNFIAPDFVGTCGKLFTRPANDIPLIFWPDRSWCSPANTFIREKYEAGLSRRNRGGSLSVIASHISHLIRYCWDSNTDLIELTDNDFRDFVGKLIWERHSKHPEQRARNSNSVISISRSCLQFLDCVNRHSSFSGLIGPDGRIRAQLKTQSVVTRNYPGRSGRRRQIQYWDHPAIPVPTIKKIRSPISTANIEKLRIAIGSSSKSAHQRMRRHTTLKLLEITGARRGEIAGITVEAVRQANNADVPMLQIPTLKKHSGSPQYRYVPISKADIAFVLQYIDIYRRSIIRKRLKGKPDHGFLLVSEVDGQPYAPNSISQEIKLLAKIANISEVICAHMFRHRFLTKLFVTLIEQHQVDNPDTFRRLLLDGEELKQKVAEWSGHASIESLDIYINLAFDEVGDYKKTYNLVNAGLALESLRGTLCAEMQALSCGEPPELVIERVLFYLNKFDNDLNSCRNNLEESSLK